jgi:AbrB family looped-hinge helix DNA binding protein
MAELGKVQPRGQITLPRAVRQAAGVKPGDTVIVRATGPGRIEIKALPRLSLEEMFERFRIEDSIDEVRDREQWEEIAARDVFGERSF